MAISDPQTQAQIQAPMVDPTSASVVVPQTVMSQVVEDEQLAKQVTALARNKDWIKLAELAYANKAKIEAQVQEIQQAIPLIKEGYKTTEFWLIILYFGFNAFCMLKGIQMPFGDDATLGGLVAAYTASRHVLKNK